MLKNTLFSLIVCAMLLSPLTVFAQFASEEEYRAYLFALIEMLQQQILLLQQDLSEPAEDDHLVVNTDIGDFESFLIGDTSDIKAWYQLAEPGSTAGIADKEHRRYFSRFFDIVPDEYDHFFVDLLVFEDRGQIFDGFVETVPPYRADTWRLGVNDSIFNVPPSSNVVAELFVHEFAHIISYEGLAGTTEPQNATCHEYFSELGCPPANSYLLDFIDEFWTEADMDAAAESNDPDWLWTNRERQENFVSNYAATDPAEDFAESFTVFVIDGRADGDDLADEKVNYFFKFEKMEELRELIRDEL